MNYKEKCELFKEYIDEYVVFNELEIFCMTELFFEFRDAEALEKKDEIIARKIIDLAVLESSKTKDEYFFDTFRIIKQHIDLKKEGSFNWKFLKKDRIDKPRMLVYYKR